MVCDQDVFYLKCCNSPRKISITWSPGSLCLGQSWRLVAKCLWHNRQDPKCSTPVSASADRTSLHKWKVFCWHKDVYSISGTRLLFTEGKLYWKCLTAEALVGMLSNIFFLRTTTECKLLHIGSECWHNNNRLLLQCHFCPSNPKS